MIQLMIQYYFFPSTNVIQIFFPFLHVDVIRSANWGAENSETTLAFLATKRWASTCILHGRFSGTLFYLCSNTTAHTEDGHRHQHQHENEEGMCPVFRICAACSSALAASWLLLASAACLFASALRPADASFRASTSCSRARFRSIFACNFRRVAVPLDVAMLDAWVSLSVFL
jgi:hypothetical protein